MSEKTVKAFGIEIAIEEEETKERVELFGKYVLVIKTIDDHKFNINIGHYNIKIKDIKSESYYDRIKLVNEFNMILDNDSIINVTIIEVVDELKFHIIFRLGNITNRFIIDKCFYEITVVANNGVTYRNTFA